MTDDLRKNPSKTKAKKQSRRNTSFGIVGTIAAFAVLGWCVNFYFALAYDWGDRSKGEFGDIFGVINSLFTGLAFIGVVWSVFTQREELAETRRLAAVAIEELEKTQRILDKQEDNIASQNATNAKQMFESTFFQMLTAFNQLVDSFTLERLEHRTPIINTSQFLVLKKFTGMGKEVFTGYLQEIAYQYSATKHNEAGEVFASPPDDNEELSRTRKRIHFQQGYQKFQHAHNGNIGRYFRSLYIILNYIEKSVIPKEDKHFYAKLIRANFSTDESTIIALNVVSGNATNEFIFLLSKYGMAKNAFRRNRLLTELSFFIPDGIYGQKLVRYRNRFGFHPTTENYKQRRLFRTM